MSPATTAKHVTVECDGGSRGNPGRAGYGALVEDDEGHVIAFDANGFLRPETNNVAEYHGLLLALDLARKVGATDVTVKADSKLVIEQMTGRWNVNSPQLAELVDAARQKVAAFRSVEFVHIRREFNFRADQLANLAMDGRPPQKPADGRPVTTRQGMPVKAAPTHVPRAERNGLPRRARIQMTARLAARLGLPAAPVQQSVAALRERVPQELADIWDRVPGVRYLVQAITQAPLAWRDGFEHGASDQIGETA